MFIYMILFFFFIFSMFMGSFLTIPLYKLMCNLSYFDYDISFFFFFKDSCINQFYTFFSYDICSLDSSTIINTGSFYYFIHTYNLLDVCTAYLSFSEIGSSFIFFTYDTNIIYIKFFASVSNFVLLEFISLQESIVVYPGESTLVFFRLYNPTSIHLCGISLYYIYPFNASVYVSKIQCFCFEFINVFPFESVELPILFFIDKLINSEILFFNNLVYISYVLFIK